MSAATRTVTVLTLATLFALAASMPLYAQSDEAFVQYRQKVMGSNGANMGAIADILKNGLPLDKNIAVHARNIAETTKLTASAFEKKITDGATDAKPEIWRDWSKFTAAADASVDKAEALVKAALGGDASAVGPAVKALGGTCGECHKQFRKPKEESYKNK